MGNRELEAKGRALQLRGKAREEAAKAAAHTKAVGDDVRRAIKRD
jgi:hypothetical protein